MWAIIMQNLSFKLNLYAEEKKTNCNLGYNAATWIIWGSKSSQGFV
jgi:hypothetical protein